MYNTIVHLFRSHPYLPGMIYIVAGRILGTAEYTRYVVNITIHENYNPSTLENDIAILKVRIFFNLLKTFFLVLLITIVTYYLLYS